MFIHKQLAAAALVCANGIILAQTIAQPLNPQTIEEMQRTMRATIYPYANVQEGAPDPQNAGAFIEYLIGGTTGRRWTHGTPQQLLNVIPIAPGHFAPVIRDRLMRLPATFDDYAMHDPRWSISSKVTEFTVGDQTFEDVVRPVAPALLGMTSLLGREHAEPILREFHDRIRPLALEAARRHRAAKEAWIAAGRPKPPYANEQTEALTQAVADAWNIMIQIGGPAFRAITIAQKLDSPIFIDDGLAMLNSDDAGVRAAGAGMVSYILHFADQRPDAVEKLRQIAARLARSTNARDAVSGQRIQKQLDKFIAERTR